MFYLTIIYNVARLLLIARLSDVTVSADEPLVGMCGNAGGNVVVLQFFIFEFRDIARDQPADILKLG